MYVAISLELVQPYIKETLESKTYPTCDAYWEWCKQLLDPNYVYLQHMTMTYFYALLMLCSGVRKCNSALIQDAKTKISCLFFGGKYAIYQNILILDTIDMVLMPEALQEVKVKYVSHSRTSHSGKFQGGDTLMEEVNKE